jgi:hypothetical protein
MKQTPRVVNTIAALAITLSAVAAGAQGLPAYGPGKVQYKISNTVATVQTMMGNVQSAEVMTDQVVTIGLAKDGAGLKLTMSLDSLNAKSNNPMVPAPDMSDLLGVTLTGAMGLDGKVEKFDLMAKGGGAATSPAALAFRPMLPKIKVGAKLGESWSDSTTTNQKQNGADVQTTLLTTAKYASDTTVNGAKAYKITVSGSMKVMGSGNQMGADFSISGTGKTDTTILLGADGVLIGLTSDSASDMMIDVPQANMQIPMQMKNTSAMVRKN